MPQAPFRLKAPKCVCVFFLVWLSWVFLAHKNEWPTFVPITSGKKQVIGWCIFISFYCGSSVLPYIVRLDQIKLYVEKIICFFFSREELVLIAWYMTCTFLFKPSSDFCLCVCFSPGLKTYLISGRKMETHSHCTCSQLGLAGIENTDPWCPTPRLHTPDGAPSACTTGLDGSKVSAHQI